MCREVRKVTPNPRPTHPTPRPERAQLIGMRHLSGVHSIQRRYIMIVLSSFSIVVEGMNIAGLYAEQPGISARQTVKRLRRSWPTMGHDVREAQPNTPG